MRTDKTQLILLILLGIFLSTTLFLIATAEATSWQYPYKNTSDIMGDDACYTNYFLHRPDTYAHGDSGVVCSDTIAGWIGIARFFVDSQYYWFPIRLDSTWNSDTHHVWIHNTDTFVIVNLDTVIYRYENGVYSAGHVEYFCDSFLTSIDTTTAPDDSSYCAWCDSFLVQTVWITDGGGTTSVQIFQSIYPQSQDTCGLFSYLYYTGTIEININISIHHTDTTVSTIVHIDSTTDRDDAHGIVVWDSLTNSYTQVDTLDIRRYIPPSPRQGIWVKRGCRDGTGACDSMFTQEDTVYAMFCIDSSWSTFHTKYRYDPWGLPTNIPYRIEGSVSNIWTWANNTCRYAEVGARKAVNVKFNYPGLNNYVPGVMDTINAYFSATDSVWTVGGWITPKQAFYCSFDTTDTFGVFTRDVGDSLACADGNREQWESDENRAYAIRYEKTIDPIDIFGERIGVVQKTQPNWKLFFWSDDFVPSITINGVDYAVDTFTGTANWRDSVYTSKVVTINPQDIDYSQLITVAVNAYSCQGIYIGAQVLFAIDGTADSSCLTWEDTIYEAPCDTCGHSFTWGPAINNQTFLSVQTCNSGLGNVLNLSPVIEWLLGHGRTYYSSTTGRESFILTGADSCIIDTVLAGCSPDSFGISVTHDSTVFFDADSHASQLNIQMDTYFGDHKLIFNDTAKNDTIQMYVTADTCHLESDDSTIIFKIGSGSVFISDKGLWFSGSSIGADKYGVALGYQCVANNDYATAFGFMDSSTGDYSMSWGGENVASGNYSTAFGYFSKATGINSTSWGNENSALKSYSTVWGTENICDGATSTAWGTNNNIFSNYSTIAGGSFCQIDSNMHLSFLIGLNDTLASDSTFRCAYPYSEFKSKVYIQNGFDAYKVDGTDTLLMIALPADSVTWDTDTFWLWENGKHFPMVFTTP